MLEGLAAHHTLIRYDERGCGLSDWDVGEISLDAMVSDLGTVVDAAGLDDFDLFGMSQGGAAAIAYAARHPERVRHLVLLNAYARGRRARGPEQRHKHELLSAAIQEGWGARNPAYRRLFVNRFLPNATPEQIDWFDTLQRTTTSAENAQRLSAAWSEIDVTNLLSSVAAPTLIVHSYNDEAVPFDEGRMLASGITGAQFVPLQSENHMLLADEPAWPVFLDAFHAFLGDGDVAGTPPRRV